MTQLSDEQVQDLAAIERTAEEWASDRIEGSLKYQLIGWLRSVRNRELHTEQKTAADWDADFQEWSSTPVN